MPKVCLPDLVVQRCRESCLSMLRHSPLQFKTLLSVLRPKFSQVSQSNLSSLLERMHDEGLIVVQGKMPEAGKKWAFCSKNSTIALSPNHHGASFCEWSEIDIQPPASPREKILVFRTKVQNVLSCLQQLRRPHSPYKHVKKWISLDVCRQVTKIHIPSDISEQEWEQVLHELTSEGIIRWKRAEHKICQGENFWSTYPSDRPFSNDEDTSMLSLNKTPDEASEVTKMRCLTRRLVSCLARERKARKDLEFLHKLIRERFRNYDVTVDMLLPHLPPEWQHDDRRNVPSYVKLSLMELMQTGLIQRNEHNETFRLCA